MESPFGQVHAGGIEVSAWCTEGSSPCEGDQLLGVIEPGDVPYLTQDGGTQDIAYAWNGCNELVVLHELLQFNLDLEDLILGEAYLFEEQFELELHGPLA